MSRGVKDLRELVSISRLSFRPSDDDDDDENNGGYIRANHTPLPHMHYSHQDIRPGSRTGSRTSRSTADSGFYGSSNPNSITPGRGDSSEGYKPAGNNAFVNSSYLSRGEDRYGNTSLGLGTFERPGSSIGRGGFDRPGSSLGRSGLNEEDIRAVREMLANANIDPGAVAEATAQGIEEGEEMEVDEKGFMDLSDTRQYTSSSSSNSSRANSSRKANKKKRKTRLGDKARVNNTQPIGGLPLSAGQSVSSSQSQGGKNVAAALPSKPVVSMEMRRPLPLPQITRAEQSSIIAGITGNLTTSVHPTYSTSTAAESSHTVSAAQSQIRRIPARSPNVRYDFADVLVFASHTVVSDWLHRSQAAIERLTDWASSPRDYARFTQFWLREFASEKRREILALERDILLDEFSVAFRAGLDAGKVTPSDLSALLKALYREYPGKLLTTGPSPLTGAGTNAWAASGSGSSTTPLSQTSRSSLSQTAAGGSDLFLDYLDIFTSPERTPAYRRILADVKLSTSHKEHAQTALAARLFTLISVWSSVVNFHSQLITLDPVTAGSATSSGDDTALCSEKLSYERMREAVACGYVEAAHFFLHTERVAPGRTDSAGRTLIVHAVACNQPRVLAYLLKKWSRSIDVNVACDTGNTALHVAANLGSVEMTQLLLSADGITVDPANPQCEGSTPLHLAVMHGHSGVVKSLLGAGADGQCLMGDMSPLSIATSFDHEDVAAILLQHQCIM